MSQEAMNGFDQRWPKISVIIPAYKAEAHLPEAIASIRRQGYPRIEIIVVDDGSPQSLEPLVRSLGADIVYHRQVNAGPAAARNRGLELASGEWITFLDADDLWPDGKLALQGRVLWTDPELDIVLGRIQYAKLEGADDVPIQLSPHDQSVTHVHLGSMLARRRAFDRIGAFDAAMRFSEDQDWFLRAREANLKIRILDAVTLLYQMHAANMTRGKNAHELRLLDALHKSIQRRRASGDPMRQLERWSSHLEQGEGGNPLVSAIIPAYNGERFIAQAIRSILQQDYSPIEILVVDDGSTDNTASLVRSFPDVRYLQQSNAGPGAARNRGIAEAKGDLLCFLDQDDYWLQGKVRAQVKYLAAHPDVDFVVTGHARYLEPGTPRPAWFRPEWLNQDLGGYEPGSLLARRSAFEKVGMFSADLVTSSDVDWFFRANDLGVKGGRIDTVLLMRRYHGTNQTNQLEAIRKDLLASARASIARRRGAAISSSKKGKQ